MSESSTQTDAAQAAGTQADQGVPADASTFSPRTLRWLIGVVVASLVATVILPQLTGGDLEKTTWRANGFSRSAIGFRAFGEVMRKLDIPVIMSRNRSGTKSSAKQPLVVALPVNVDVAKLEPILRNATARGASIVFVLPKWRAAPSSAREGWVSRASRLALAQVDETLGLALATLTGDEPETGFGVGATSLVAVDAYPGAEAPSLDIEDAQTVSAGTLEPLLAQGDSVLIGQVPGADVYVITDPDLLNTMGIRRGDHAEVIYRFFRDTVHAESIIFDETVHGFHKAEGILAELTTPPLVVLTAHLVLLAVLALWATLARFGRPAPAPPRIPPGKEALLANTSRLLARSKDRSVLVERYLRATIRAGARARGISQSDPQRCRDALQAILDREHPGSPSLQELQAQVAILGAGRRDGQAALAIANHLHTIRQALVG